MKKLVVRAALIAVGWLFVWTEADRRHWRRLFRLGGL